MGVRALAATSRVLSHAQARIRRALNWLVDDETAAAVTTAGYERMAHYRQDWHQDLGLFDFERAAMDAWFPTAPARVFVPGCGARRELVALSADGYECIGADPAPGLVEAARRRLPGVTVEVAALGAGPVEGADAILVGWGAWGHVLTSRNRVAILRRFRAACDGPVLISWRSEQVPGISGWAHTTGQVRAGVGKDPPPVRRVATADGTVHVVLNAAAVTDEAARAGYRVAASGTRGSAGYPHAVLVPEQTP